MADKSEKFIVSGIVQGVGFRYYTCHQAQKLGLTGYARNVSNGDVEVVACGDSSHIEYLYSWLKRGSPMASVDKVQRCPHTPEKPYRNFSVKY